MRLFFIIILFLTGAQKAQALSSPIGVSLFPISENLAIAFPGPKYRVAGVRTGLISKNLDVYGFDIGILSNITSATFGGIGISGGLNYVGRNTMISGLQLAGLINANQGSIAIYGLQIAGLINANMSKGYLVGAQIALLKNHSSGSDIYGMQLALVNSAKTLNGIQIGLINIAGTLRGIQIGILNFNLNSRPFGFFPGVNVGF